MHRRRDRVVLVSLLWECACVTSAAHSKQAASTAHGGSAAQDTTPTPPAEATAAPWREMTWSEYYASVMRNAERRGAMVIWINPPEVRTVDRIGHSTTKAPASSVSVGR
jgi:hypothetical protein